MEKYKVLATKKLTPALLAEARGFGMDIKELEFISILPLQQNEIAKKLRHITIRKNTFLVFTSSHAVTILDRYLQESSGLNTAASGIYCISGKTYAAVQNAIALHVPVTGTANDATDLAQLIIKDGVKELIFFCGNRRRDILPQMTARAGIRMEEIILYHTEETPAPVSEAFDAVLFFSPSGVHSYFSMNAPAEDTVYCAIGKTTANAITGYTDNFILTSEKPEPEQMLHLLRSYFENRILQQRDK